MNKLILGEPLRILLVFYWQRPSGRIILQSLFLDSQSFLHIGQYARCVKIIKSFRRRVHRQSRRARISFGYSRLGIRELTQRSILRS